jgi:lipoate-protein ligase A
MKFYRMKSKDIRMNLATEEYLMNHVDISEPCLLLYIQKPCVIIGRNQNAYEEINFDYLRQNDIVLTRRTSGGGAVYDDLGNMSFSFVTKKDATHFGDYHGVTQPILNALQKMGAQNVEVQGRNDLFVDGKKFSGNAMYTKNDRSYSHGTLMFDVDLSVLTKVLNVPQEKIASKATKSVRKSVTNIKPYLSEEYQQLTTEEFRDQLLCHIYDVEVIESIQEKELILTEEDQQQIQHLYQTRYANDQWIYGEAPKYQWTKRKRFENVGIVEIRFSVAKGKIAEVQITGDFFGEEDIHHLEEQLIGLPYNEDARDEFEQLQIDPYIHQLTKEQFISLLFN